MKSNAWKAICFSQIESTKNDIESKIEEKIKKTHGYGCEYRDYIYAEFSENLCANLFHEVACSIKSRIGAIAFKVGYWDKKGIAEQDKPKNITNPLLVKPGCAFSLGIVNIYENEKPTFSDEELDIFRTEINQVVPYKYKPIYASENEIRLLVYCFDNCPEELDIKFQNSTDYFNKGRYECSFCE